MKLVIAIFIVSFMISCNQDSKQFSRKETPKVSSAEMLEVFNKSDLAAVHQELSRSSTADVFQFIQNNLTNDAVEIDGVRFVESKTRLQEMQPLVDYISEKYPTYGEFLESIDEGDLHIPSKSEMTAMMETSAAFLDSGLDMSGVVDVFANQNSERQVDLSTESVDGSYPFLNLAARQKRKPVTMCGVRKAVSEMTLGPEVEVTNTVSCVLAGLAKVGILTAETMAEGVSGGLLTPIIAGAEAAQTPLNAFLGGCAGAALWKGVTMLAKARNDSACQDQTPSPNEAPPITPVLPPGAIEPLKYPPGPPQGD